jgi:small subunit ribosomal protein S16
VSVKIRLKRLGKIRAPYYRIVVADSRTKRDGRAIEEIGKYHPTEDPSFIEVDSARAQYWLGVGAQPTEQVLAILKVTGDWQKFKGLPGAEGTLRHAAPKADKKAVFEEAARETLDQGKEGATTPKARKKAEPKSSAKGEPAAAAEPAKDDAPAQPAPEAPEQPSSEAPVQPADAADEGAPGGSETSAQTAGADGTSQAEG